MNIKNNQRFREMAARMEGAMLELLEITEPEIITVREICRRAKVNRSTFYAHYLDIYDLLDKMEAQMQQCLRDSYGDEVSAFQPEGSMLPFLRHIQKNQRFYRIALRTRTQFPLKQGYSAMWETVIKPRCLAAGITDEKEMLYYFIAFQAGFTFQLRCWVENDCKEPVEKIAEIIDNSVPAIWK